MKYFSLKMLENANAYKEKAAEYADEGGKKLQVLQNYQDTAEANWIKYNEIKDLV
jgi:hypothetical protein